MAAIYKTKNVSGPVLQEIVANTQGKHYRRLKNALWIYLYLIIFANPKNGKLTTGISIIAKATGFQEETIRSWLGVLKKWQYISIEKQGKNFIFKVNRWKKLFKAFEDLKSNSSITPTKGRRTSISKFLPKDPKELAKYIAEDLDVKSSLTHLEKICRAYHRDVIVKAFNKLKEVPEQKVKSKIALFIYLTKKYDKEK